MSNMPLFFYPTTLLWVDDDELFLQSAIEGFKRDFYITACYSPQDCLNIFNKGKSISTSLDFLQGYTEHEDYDMSNHLPVDINLKNIFELRKNHQRLKDVAVVIVDYNMPEMTGIELCRQLKGIPSKKILLTGEASHHHAVNAFNEGIIDCFMRKDDPNLAADLLMYIKKMQVNYFSDLAKPLLAHLEADYQLPQSDSIFIAFFNEWCRTHKISEYYIIDKNGHFAATDYQGQLYYFVIHTERTLNTFSNLYREDKDAAFFVKLAMSCNKIPFFGPSKESWDFKISDWGRYFFSPQILEGREKYYWAVVNNKELLTNKNFHLVQVI